MGLLDSLEQMAAQQMQQVGGSDMTKVAGGLMQALEEHPGGLQGAMNQMQQNGVDAQSMASGQMQATPAHIQQGLNGTGLIESVAAKAGVSPQVAEMAMAVVLPMVMAHFTQNGQAAPPQSGFGGMASQILSRFL